MMPGCEPSICQRVTPVCEANILRRVMPGGRACACRACAFVLLSHGGLYRCAISVHLQGTLVLRYALPHARTVRSWPKIQRVLQLLADSCIRARRGRKSRGDVEYIYRAHRVD